MSNKKLSALMGLALVTVQWLAPPIASAVGGGLNFTFREGFVAGSMAHPVNASGMDFTSFACVDFTAAGQFTENGYAWISSFQDIDSVVDSQINDFQANGYHLYAKYSYEADQCNAEQQTCNGLDRRNYAVEQASISLFLDPLSDTTLAIQNCAVVANGAGDDIFLGFANGLEAGQKSETDDLANGDYELRFGNWVFTGAGMNLFRIPGGMAPLVAPNLVFNGNVTRILGPLTNDHHTEGSGNLYWID
jgi:hypothetical protein